MNATAALAGILGALFVGVVSPGPSFVLVARTAVARSRRDGLAAALGMGIGGLFFASLALLGLQAVLARVGWLDLGLKLLGGLYLVYLGLAMWRGASAPLALPDSGEHGAANPGRSFAVGLATQLSNPKTAIVYAGVFAALLPPAPPAWLYAALLPLILAIETSWYSAVALVLSSGGPRAAYGRCKRWIDRAAGSIMAVLGLRLIIAAGRSGS